MDLVKRARLFKRNKQRNRKGDITKDNYIVEVIHIILYLRIHLPHFYFSLLIFIVTILKF